ncbi:hypothetical protein JOS77_14180 [Chromobacterium haemolyticum]|nr:hypothetical protein JOS77_14180 [Chromobacterium haemolyticum]
MNPWLRPIGLALLVIAVSGLIAGGGYQVAANVYQAKLDRLHADYARERQSQAEAQATALDKALREQTALNEQAHRLGVELLNTRAELVAAHAALKRRIPDATRSTTALLLLALALQGCGSTPTTSAMSTPQRACPQPTPEMLQKPMRPPPPRPGYYQSTSWLIPPITALGARRWSSNSTA